MHRALRDLFIPVSMIYHRGEQVYIPVVKIIAVDALRVEPAMTGYNSGDLCLNTACTKCL